MNLWDIYRGFYQRSHRNSWDEEAVENTDLFHSWLKELFIRQRRGGLEEHLADGVALAEILFTRESLAGSRVYYSARLKRALTTGDWTLKIPPHVLHRWFSSVFQYPGHVYILTSPEHPSQFKVGATTIPMRKRIAAYEKRYGTYVDLFISLPCIDPFEIEKRFLKSTLFTRVCGNSSYDSVEWFFGDPGDASRALKGLIAERSDADHIRSEQDALRR
jgi:hypothetical protein